MYIFFTFCFKLFNFKFVSLKMKQMTLMSNYAFIQCILKVCVFDLLPRAFY